MPNGDITGAITLVIKRGEGVAGMLIFGLALISGAYFPVSVLPDWIQPLSDVVPTRYAIDGLREALFEGSGWSGDLAVLAAFGFALLPLAILSFSAALTHLRRLGSMAEY
jgi:ABC-2 type transport system permease protein